MPSARLEALVVAAAFALAWVVLCVIVVVVCWRAATGKLERNLFVGIRAPATLRSDEAWVVGHRAGLRHAPLLGLAMAAVSSAQFLLAWRGRTAGVVVSGFVGMFAVVVMVIYLAVVAGRAARAVDPGAGYDTAGRDLADRPPPRLLSRRAGRALTWTGALIAWAATILALAGVVYGYVQAAHHNLPPNGSFGFRDSATFSCLSAWYAGQTAGFGWALWGWGPFLVFAIVACPVAAIKGRDPGDLLVVSAGTLFLGAVALLIAGIHADNVARAVMC
jgi:hypothetical protein